MSVKITISVPDDLVTEAEPFKDKISPSRLYQNALRAELSKLRERQDGLPKGQDMDVIIERLRKEKAESESHFYEDGLKEGQDVIKSASYDDVKAAVRIAEEMRDFYREYSYYNGDIFFKNEDWGEYFQHEDECGYTLETAPDSQVCELTDASVKWVKGWCDAVTDFWDQLPADIKG